MRKVAEQFNQFSLEEKRIILHSLFKSYSAVNDGNYNSANVNLKNAISLYGRGKNQTLNEIETSLAKGNFGHFKNAIKDVINNFIGNMTPTNYN